MPIARAVRMMRQAISPRLAMRIFANTGPTTPPGASLREGPFHRQLLAPGRVRLLELLTLANKVRLAVCGSVARATDGLLRHGAPDARRLDPPASRPAH